MTERQVMDRQLLLKTSGKESWSFPVLRSEVDLHTVIRNKMTRRRNQVLSTFQPPVSTEIASLVKSLIDLKSGKLGSLIAATKDGEPVSITYDSNTGYTLFIETKEVCSDVDFRKVAVLFQALTVGK